MKKLLLTLTLIALAAFSSSAEKKALDHSVYDGWKRATIIRLSADAGILVYMIIPQEGDAEMHVRRTATGEELVIPRGTAWSMTEDGTVATVTIKAEFAKTREAKIKKKKAADMPKDTLAYVRLADFDLVKLTGVNPALPDSVANKKKVKINSLKIGTAASPYVIADADDPAKKGRKMLLLIDWKTGAVDTLRGTDGVVVSRDGCKLAVTTKKDKKDSLTLSSIYLYDVLTRKADTLSRDRKEYRNIEFNHDSDKLTFTATDQDAKKVGSARHSIFLAEEKTVSKATRRKPAVKEVVVRELVKEDNAGLPEGWIVGDGTKARFSNGSGRLILNLRKFMPPKDTTVADFEAAKLDIWRWDSTELPPEAKKNRNQPERTAIINLSDPGKVIVLSNSPSDRIQFIQGADGDIALSTDTEAYDLSNYWALDRKCDISLLSLRDGSRTVISEGACGKSLSPHGKYLTWFSRDDAEWHCMSLASGKTVKLTEGLGVSFRNTDIDTPHAVTTYGGPFWMGEDECLILPDRYDLWKMSPDGKERVCLTAGEGRRTGVRYRVTWFDSEDYSHLFQYLREVPVKTTLPLTVFDENTMQNGFATVSSVKPNVPVGFTEPCSFNAITKKKGHDLMVFQKGDFKNPMDIYVGKGFLDAVKITDMKAQMEGWLWGDAQLVSWTAYDGTPLKGILYTPENLDPAGKYPMIVYFYEKNTQNLFAHYSPAPSRSVVNFPYFTSNGYVVFVPDIVYETGHPGESAWNCICSGTEAMCAQFPFINKDKVGIQGQSWGGYQVAYLVTRTDMFAAGGAGAPVGNMTSAYGGIRWGSGNSRIMQYEAGQSRIGKNLWEEGGRELYIENSPVFFADKVKTPVLIMHNDNDGAVPWYQGIEFFMALRRLGKPAWLLEYNGEEHNLGQRRNSKDLSVRLQQFFDVYLKDAPVPVWMQEDIPQSYKGNYFGFEFK
jgi:dipeptidyl aminopeptidase/acylaminoacyl peptidase